MPDNKKAHKSSLSPSQSCAWCIDPNEGTQCGQLEVL